MKRWLEDATEGRNSEKLREKRQKKKTENKEETNGKSIRKAKEIWNVDEKKTSYFQYVNDF